MKRFKKKYKNLNRYMLDEGISDFASSAHEGDILLDIGAGSGHYRRFFSSQKYVAIDRGIEQGSYKGLDLVGDVNELPLKDGFADAVLCAEVLEHVPSTDLLMKEINRVLKDGGRLLLTVPLCLGEHMVPFDFHRFTRYALSELFEAHGFRVIRIEPRGGYFTLLAYLLARIPDQLVRHPGIFRKIFKNLLRWTFTYFLAPLFVKLDRWDDRKTSTLGFVCEAEKAISVR